MRIPQTHPQLTSLTACIIGLALTDGFDAWEQNALGNWLMLISQVLVTNATIYHNNNKIQSYSNSISIDQIIKALEIMKKEIEELKKDL